MSKGHLPQKENCEQLLRSISVGGSPETRIKLLNDLASWPLGLFAEHFDSTLAALQTCMGESSVRTVRSASLNCALSFLSSCKTTYHVGLFFTALCPKVSHFFNSLIDELQKLRQTTQTDGQIVASLFKQQRECIQFLTECVKASTQIPSLKLASVYSLIEHTFLIIHASLIRSGEVALALSSLAPVAAEADLLYKETKTILTTITSFLGSVQFSFEEEQTPTRKHSAADTLIMVCTKLTHLGEISVNPAVLNVVWKSLKELVFKYDSILTQHWNVSPIIRTLCSLTDLSVNDAMRFAPRQNAAQNEQEFKGSIRLVRYFLPLLHTLWEHFASTLTTEYENTILFCVKALSKLPSTQVAANGLTADALHQLENYVAPKYKLFCRMMFVSAPTDNAKTSILTTLSQLPDEKYSLGKILFLLELFRGSGSENTATQSAFITKELIRCMLWMKESLQTSYFDVIQMYSKLVMECSTFMLKALTFSDTSVFHEIEHFLLDYLIDKHFMCSSLSQDLWQFIIKHSSEELLERHLAMLLELVLHSFDNNHLIDILVACAAQLFTDSTIANITQFLCNRVIPLLTDRQKESIFNKLVSLPFADKSGNMTQTSFIFMTEFPLILFPFSVKQNLSPAVAQPCIDFIGKWNASPESYSLSSLHRVVQCLHGLMKHTQLVEQFVSQQVRQRVTDAVIQLLAKSQLWREREVICSIVDLAGDMLPFTPPPKIISMLSSLCEVPSICPETVIPISEFLSKSSACKIDSLQLQNEIVTKYALLWHTLLSDTDWLVFSEVCRNFRHFAQFTFYQDIGSFIPKERQLCILQYIDSKPFEVSAPLALEEAVEQHGRELAQYGKRRKMQNVLTRSQSLTPPSTSSQTASDVNTVSKPDELLSPMDILKKSVKQIKEGLQQLHTLPPNMNEGSISWLKQEIKSMKTMLMSVEDTLYNPNSQY